MYFEPWLWYDGDQHGGFDYYSWESMITSQMDLPSPVTIRFWGDYTPTEGSGTVYAQYRNDSTATINGCAVLLITEDSLFYAAPNGLMWHNNIPRDYLPDHNGTLISIPPGDSVVVSQSFTIDALWNENMCRIIAYVQDTVMQADSTFEVWQGGMVNVLELAVAERGERSIAQNMIQTFPNPCDDILHFAFSLPERTAYAITLYDAGGRLIKNLHGQVHTGNVQLVWDRTDSNGDPVSPGVYFYRFVSAHSNATGKIVIR